MLGVTPHNHPPVHQFMNSHHYIRESLSDDMRVEIEDNLILDVVGIMSQSLNIVEEDTEGDIILDVVDIILQICWEIISTPMILFIWCFLY